MQAFLVSTLLLSLGGASCASPTSLSSDRASPTNTIALALDSNKSGLTVRFTDGQAFDRTATTTDEARQLAEQLDEQGAKIASITLLRNGQLVSEEPPRPTAGETAQASAPALLPGPPTNANRRLLVVGAVAALATAALLLLGYNPFDALQPTPVLQNPQPVPSPSAAARWNCSYSGNSELMGSYQCMCIQGGEGCAITIPKGRRTEFQSQPCTIAQCKALQQSLVPPAK